MKEILSSLHIEALSDMQQRTIDAARNTGGDIIVLSPTGSGKTLAYLLSLYSQLDAAIDAVQAIVVVPGRELALQSCEVLQAMHCGLRGMAVYGGRPAMDEHREMRRVRPQIVFGTPGRLNDHIAKGNIDVERTAWLVIDEFDKCLAMGFREEMYRLAQSLENVRRRILLSATDSPDFTSFTDETVRIYGVAADEAQAVSDSYSRVQSFAVHSTERDKLPVLDRLLRTLGETSTIVFLNHRDAVERTYQYLSERGFSVVAMHGGMEQPQREEALFLFATGCRLTLIATDLASRGIDIPDIANIVHYQLAYSQTEYTHRTGRTARWESTGRTFTILGPGETMPDYMPQSEDFALSTAGMPASLPQPPYTLIYIGKGKQDKISRGDILGFICKKGGLTAADIGRIDLRDRCAFVAVAREKAPQMLRQISGEKIKGIKTAVEIKRS